MKNQCGSRDMPKIISGYWQLNQPDIDLMSKVFKKIRRLKSNQCCNRGYKIISLKKYGFQFLGVIINNKKYIYLNAFPISKFDPNPVLNTTPVIICDGGIRYWGALFSIDYMNFSQLAINGPPMQTLQ
jgi:hypothetical protein